MTEGPQPEEPGPLSKVFAWFAEAETLARNAETRMDLPQGTITNIRHDPPNLAVIKSFALIEPLLNDALAVFFRRRLGFNKVAEDGIEAIIQDVRSRSFDRRIYVCWKCDIITESTYHFALAVSVIRNHYAHHIRNQHLGIKEMIEKMPPTRAKEAKRLVNDLDEGAELTEGILRGSLQYGVLKIITEVEPSFAPPPPLPAGLFGLGASSLIDLMEPSSSERWGKSEQSR
jgi:hypothetical protein